MKQNRDVFKRMTVGEFLEEVGNFEETVFQIQITNRFKKSLDLSFRRNLDLTLLKEVIHTLAKGEILEAKYRAHILGGCKSVIWECHVKPDWLLLWQQIDDELILILLTIDMNALRAIA